MSQIVTTPDGVEHEFPDGTSDDVIKGALSSYSKPQTPATPQGYQSPSWLPGAGWLHKMSNIFDDSATFGGADAATGTVGNLLRNVGVQNATPDVATLRAQTGQNRTDVGPIASAAADIAGYAVGPGAVGAGEKLAGRLGGSLWARMGGSAAENAAAAGAGTLGHGGSLQDAGTAATIGGLTGALTGALPGGRGARPVTPPTSELKTNMQNAFQPLENTWVNARNTGQNFNKVTSSLPTRTDLSSNFNSKVDEIAKEIGDSSGVLSADTIARYQRVLGGAARNDIDKNAARNYVDALDTSLGPHAPAVDAANTLASKFKTSREIDKWLTDLAGAPSAIASRLNKKPQFYQGDVGGALREIGAKAPSDESIASAAGKAAASAVGKHLLGAAIGGGVGYMTGQGLPGDIAGLALGAAVPSAAGRIASRVASIPTRNALLAARHLNATGIPVSPGVYTPRWLQGLGVMSRQAGYGLGASGAL